jgi:hypothetical protein
MAIPQSFIQNPRDSCKKPIWYYSKAQRFVQKAKLPDAKFVVTQKPKPKSPMPIQKPNDSCKKPADAKITAEKSADSKARGFVQKADMYDSKAQ